KPFQLNPDPSFFFGSKGHRRALAYLEYGLHQSEGFIVITGEIGAGKTTLLRALAGDIDVARGGVLCAGTALQDIAPLTLAQRRAVHAQ
ncbi:ATP-binding cassette domain-containing protein, partial [Salmonella enterica subsp. enterica serovar Typhimurium]|nr:ATP-binding cassette domain-containing protein [Salmonella enterica subsp. enterica serovar Typhimurium]